MLFAQEAAPAANQLADYTLLIAILLPAATLAFVTAILVLAFRHVRFTREKLHAERLKMIEAGYPLEEPESTQRRQKYMHNAFWISFWMVFGVPSAAFSAAASVSDRLGHSGFLLAIWIGASLASIAAVVCAAVLMMSSRTSGEDDESSKLPVKKPKPPIHGLGP